MQRLQRNTADAKRDAFLDANIRAGKPVESRRGNFAACGLLQFKRGSNMVRVDMRLDAIDQSKSEALEFGDIPFERRDNRVDQQRLPGFLASKQIGIGAG